MICIHLSDFCDGGEKWCNEKELHLWLTVYET